VPYADGPKPWIDGARAAGHEILLSVPMEPAKFPAVDPGPRALLTALSPQENMARLHWALSRMSGYVGVVDDMGSRFTEAKAMLEPVLADIKQRGLMYLDSRSSPRSVVPDIAREIGLTWASNTATIDDSANAEAIDARLAALERIAGSEGRAIGIGRALPVTLDRVRRWAGGLERRGLVLAPVSAMANAGAAG